MTDNDSSKSLPSDDEDEHEEEYDDEMAYGYNYFDIGEQLHGDRTYEIVRKIGYGFIKRLAGQLSKVSISPTNRPLYP